MNLPKRKPTRLRNYDYNTAGAYFITICTKDRRCILSDISVGAIHESPVLKLKKYGKIADKTIQALSERYKIEIPKYVIMPNHIHMLVVITDAEILRAIRESPLRARSVISKVIGYMKMNISKGIHKISPDEHIWQRSFHDHIIRDQKDYERIWTYIDINPHKWEQDCLYPKTDY